MREIVSAVVAQISSASLVDDSGHADLVIVSREARASDPSAITFRSSDSENVILLGDTYNILATPHGVITVVGGLATLVELVEGLSQKPIRGGHGNGNGHGQHPRPSRQASSAHQSN
jgi:hypothetical protein